MASKVADPNTFLSFRYDRTLTQEGSRWVAKSHALGFAGYGATKVEALRRLYDGITVTVNAVSDEGGLLAVREWVDASEIRHFISSDDIAGHVE